MEQFRVLVPEGESEKNSLKAALHFLLKTEHFSLHVDFTGKKMLFTFLGEEFFTHRKGGWIHLDRLEIPDSGIFGVLLRRNHMFLLDTDKRFNIPISEVLPRVLDYEDLRNFTNNQELAFPSQPAYSHRNGNEIMEYKTVSLKNDKTARDVDERITEYIRNEEQNDEHSKVYDTSKMSLKIKQQTADNLETNDSDIRSTQQRERIVDLKKTDWHQNFECPVQAGFDWQSHQPEINPRKDGKQREYCQKRRERASKPEKSADGKHRNGPKQTKKCRNRNERVSLQAKAKVCAERKDVEEIVKRRKEKYFRCRDLSDISKHLTKIAQDATAEAEWLKSLTDFEKYKKEGSKADGLLATMIKDENYRHTEILVYPAKKSKHGKSSRGQSQERRGRNPQGAEGGEDGDKYPVQVSEAAWECLDLPPVELVVTSTTSTLHTRYCGPSPTTNQLSVDAERSLFSRIRGQLPDSRFSVPVEPPKHPEYTDQSSRQRSYINWPQTTGQDPARMAICGLFYTGQFDLVRCFQCGIGLENWTNVDEPLLVHIRLYPNCPFLKDLLGQDLLNTYMEDIQNRQATGSSSTSTGSGTQATSRSRIWNPQYADLQARIRSFLSWPSTNQQRPEVLANAGFFFTGTNDLCRCFFCDGGLQRWDSKDDPWIEHAHWFPSCPYVLQIKGQDYIDMVQQAAAAAREEDDPVVPGQGRERPLQLGMEQVPLEDRYLLQNCQAKLAILMGCMLLVLHEFSGRSRGARSYFTADKLIQILREMEARVAAIPPSSPTETTPSLTLEALAENMAPEEFNRLLRGNQMCMVCEENDSNILFLPCTHHRMCDECARNVTVCPICGRQVEDKIQTFMS